MKKLDKLEALLRQNPTGIRIVDAARKLGVHRTTVYSWLESLDLMGRAYYERGIAYPGKRSTKTEEQPSKPPPLNLWGLLKWRRIYADEQREKEIKELKVDDAVLHEEMEMERSMTPEEKAKEIRKYRKLYGLS